MEKKKRKYKIWITISVILICGLFIALYYLFWPLISIPLLEIDGVMLGIVIILVRAAVLGIMSFYLFKRWFKQEAIYSSDAYFLFGCLFGLFSFAKLFDILNNLINLHSTLDKSFILIFMKIRYLFIIITIIPILYLAFESFLTFINLYKKNEMSQKEFNRIRVEITIAYLAFFTIFITLAPNENFLIFSLPYITIFIIIAISFMFLYMYKNKRLSQANGLIIGLTFLLFTCSNVLRSFLTAMFATQGVIISETIDTGINFLMFIGFITKPKYAK
jgi:MFS family permease